MVGKQPWSDLFVKHTFFTSDYKYYISVISASKTKEAHNIWSGYVESKVRMLVQKLEQHPSIALAHAFNKGYERRHHCIEDSEIAQVQDGSLDFLTKDVDGIKSSVVVMKGSTVSDEGGSTFPIDVFTTTHYIGLRLSEDAKSLDLSYQVDEFKALCTQWQKYQEELKPLVSIGVQHVRNFNLPDDVFDGAEKKPQKKSNKAKKREAPEDNPPPAKRQQASVAAVG